MTDVPSGTAFWPKQIIPPTPENYKELAKDAAERLAAVSLEQIPAIPAGAVIHDNGCGHGSATAVIMASANPEVAATYKITGTDISGGAVGVYCDRADTLGWPAQGLVMDSDKLKFQDETFTHTIANALIFVGPRNNGVDAVKEMYRTLKPGGALIVNCFAYVPVLEPIREASRVTRSGGTLPAWNSFEQWTDPAFIANIVEAGGFERGSIKVEQREMLVNIGDFDRHTTLVWSMRGMPSNGWSQIDEDRWDEALEIVRREMRKTEGFKTLDDGTTVIRSLINVATATK
ncbi:S-adenosyl-L-methionine-dependent methyltransferase [Trichoderma barbatum]